MGNLFPFRFYKLARRLFRMFPSICAYRATVVNSEALTGQQWLVIQTNLSDISGRTCPAYNINSCAKTHVTACNTFCRTEASAKYFRITLKWMLLWCFYVWSCDKTDGWVSSLVIKNKRKTSIRFFFFLIIYLWVSDVTA